jgi:WD40 repeat protein
MRSMLIAAFALVVTACGYAGPKPVTGGPRLEASLAATWPAAAPARQTTFRRDGRLLATSDASGAIIVRETSHWKVLEQLAHPGGATSIAFSRDGTHLYSGGYDATVRDWDLFRQVVTRTFNGPRGTIWTLDVSPAGTKLAAAGEDALIRIWNPDRPGAPLTLKGHGRNVWDIRFSPDGTQLASGSFDHDARLWDTTTGKPLHVLKGHSQAIVGLDYSPDGKLLATGADDSTIRFWRASDGARLRVIQNGRHVDKVAFSPDGRWLASGGHARSAFGTLWHELTGGGSDGDSVRIWRVADGALVTNLPHPDDVIYVAFSRDGRWLVTSGEDNRFRLWRLQLVEG